MDAFNSLYALKALDNLNLSSDWANHLREGREGLASSTFFCEWRPDTCPWVYEKPKYYGSVCFTPFATEGGHSKVTKPLITSSGKLLILRKVSAWTQNFSCLPEQVVCVQEHCFWFKPPETDYA